MGLINSLPPKAREGLLKLLNKLSGIGMGNSGNWTGNPNIANHVSSTGLANNTEPTRPHGGGPNGTHGGPFSAPPYKNNL